MLAGEAGGHLVDFLDFFIDISLEVQEKNIVKYETGYCLDLCFPM